MARNSGRSKLVCALVQRRLWGLHAQHACRLQVHLVHYELQAHTDLICNIFCTYYMHGYHCRHIIKTHTLAYAAQQLHVFQYMAAMTIMHVLCSNKHRSSWRSRFVLRHPVNESLSYANPQKKPLPVCYLESTAACMACTAIVAVTANAACYAKG